jgi:hypothetical protein
LPGVLGDGLSADPVSRARRAFYTEATARRTSSAGRSGVRVFFRPLFAPRGSGCAGTAPPSSTRPRQGSRTSGPGLHRLGPEPALRRGHHLPADQGLQALVPSHRHRPVRPRLNASSASRRTGPRSRTRIGSTCPAAGRPSPGPVQQLLRETPELGYQGSGNQLTPYLNQGRTRMSVPDLLPRLASPPPSEQTGQAHRRTARASRPARRLLPGDHRRAQPGPGVRRSFGAQRGQSHHRILLA